MRKKRAAPNSVRVAVRVRPLNAREVRQGEETCVEMSDQTTVAVDPENGREYKYTYDYSYWSIPGTPSFASQQTVFDDLGRALIADAFDGFNSCIFAYGQTGSGKSYTQYGPKDDPGIIPRLCHGLFDKIKLEDANPESPVITHRVEVSMMEIYNEKVRDLFNPTNPKNATGLRVRENPATGPYVDGLTKNIAETYDEINIMLEEGSKLRTIGATGMNDQSSRAHTIFQIEFVQIFDWTRREAMANRNKGGGDAGPAAPAPSSTKSLSVRRGKSKKGQRKSRINLIDLAGSERQGKAQTSGQRLREGASINLSLTMLGTVINKLADLSRAKGGAGFVPYRNSKLTWLLKESLGGNSRTVMIATISPAAYNFAETLSTLKYANRAKDIQNHAVQNEDPQSKLINELRQEIERLREMLSQRVLNVDESAEGEGEDGRGPSTAPATPEKRMRDSEEKMKLLQRLEASKRMFEELQMSNEDRLMQTKFISEERKKALRDAGVSADYSRKVVPHIVNLNEDPSLSESLLYFFKPDDVTRIGNVKKIDQFKTNDVTLTGERLQAEHCFVENIDNTNIFITPCPLDPVSDSEDSEDDEQEEEEGEDGRRSGVESYAPLFINGKPISVRTELHTHDRVIIGIHHIFRFQNPNETGVRTQAVIDWEYVRKEMETHLQEEIESRRMEEQGKMDREFQARRELEEAKISQLIAKRKTLQETFLVAAEGNERRKREELARAAEIKKLESDVSSFHEKLSREKDQKKRLETESRQSSEKVQTLKHSVEDLRMQLLAQKEETLNMEAQHRQEKAQLETQTRSLHETMEELRSKLMRVEEEKQAHESEHELQVQKLSTLKGDVSTLRNRLRSETALKEQLQQESERLARSEAELKGRYHSTRDLLIAKTQEQAQLLPILQQMMAAQDSVHQKQIAILEEQIVELRQEISRTQESHERELERLEGERAEQKSGFVVKLLGQIDALMREKQALTKNLAALEENVEVKQLQMKLYKLEQEKLALSQMNDQLTTLAQDRLDIIKGLQDSITEFSS